MVSSSSPSRSARVCCGRGCQSTWKGVTCQPLAGAWSKTARIGASAMTRRDLSSTLPLKSTAATVVSPASSWWRWSWPEQVSGPHRRALRRGLVGVSRVAILHPLPQRDRTAGVVARPEADRSVQAIVGLEDERALAVAPLDLVAQRVRAPCRRRPASMLSMRQRTVGEVVACSGRRRGPARRSPRAHCRECRRWSG